MSNDIEELAIKCGAHKYMQPNYAGAEPAWRYIFKLPEIEAFVAALSQPQEPVANKNCSICNGTGQYCVGTSNDESDGNAPILERCECYLDNVAPDQSAYIKRLEDALNEINNWLVCAPIARAEDMAQSFEYMQNLTSLALASKGAT